jgi:lysophospholipase L1-like esterase
MTRHPLLIIGIVLVIVLAYQAVRVGSLLKKSVVLITSMKPYSRTIEEPSKTIVFLGDSTAYGTGSNTPEESTAGRFGALYPDATIRNYGVNGQKIHELVETLDTIDFSDADLIVIQIGANDIVRLTPVESIEKDLAILLSRTTKVTKNIILLHGGNVGLAPIFPFPIDKYYSYKTRMVRKIYLNAEEFFGIQYIDLYRDKESDIFLTDINRYYANDVFHPSGEGYRVWFEEMVKEL